MKIQQGEYSWPVKKKRLERSGVRPVQIDPFVGKLFFLKRLRIFSRGTSGPGSVALLLALFSVFFRKLSHT